MFFSYVLLVLKIFGGLMKFDLWSKTLLKSYGMLDKAIGSIDRAFDKIINSSYCASSYDTLFNNTKMIADKLLSLIEKKKVLVRTQKLVDDILAQIDKYYAKLLVLKYINNISNEQLSHLLNISIRTILRHSQVAINEFSKAIEMRGLKQIDFFEAFLEQKWIFEIYKRTEKEDVTFAERTEKFYNKSK